MFPRIFFVWLCAAAIASAEPIFRTDDVVALVGGEDMVVAAENGSLEVFIVTALPQMRLRFRSLAWEGDTVYEQPRDLNYPSLEDQLQRIGATVVIAMFGQAEVFDGVNKVGAFKEAYEKLARRLSADGQRRLVLIAPLPSETVNAASAEYARAVEEVGEAQGAKVVRLMKERPDGTYLRDGIHLSPHGQNLLAIEVCQAVTGLPSLQAPAWTPLRLIQEKNRLWFNYYRPQNWAFLAGDRTNQPSSRDHLDPSKRWFPAEMEEYLPLIAAKERAINEALNRRPAP